MMLPGLLLPLIGQLEAPHPPHWSQSSNNSLLLGVGGHGTILLTLAQIPGISPQLIIFNTGFASQFLPLGVIQALKIIC